MKQAVNLSVSAKAAGQTLQHFWSKCVGAGRANEGLRASWQEQLQQVADNCGFQYVRFHGLLHDDMFVARKVDGKIVYNYQYIDELFDRLLDIGVRPFVEFGFCPSDLASGDATVFWWKGNISPPADQREWYDLIYHLVLHWKERYGLDEIRNWYYEVWNEPNFPVFWDGTRSEYFELYKTTVQAVKAVDSKLKVGGPATTNFVPDDRFAGEREDPSKRRVSKSDNIKDTDWRPVWIKEFLAHCAAEQLPVDFISMHPYPTNFALDGFGSRTGFSRDVNSTQHDLRILRQIVSESAFPNAEIHLTEWSSTPSSRDHGHDHLPAAAFIVKANVESIGLVDSLVYWTFTDIFEEFGAGSSIFHGGFGLLNFQGIVKPTYHAYRFLNTLGDELLTRQDGVIVTRHQQSDKISALLYHYDDEAVPTAVPLSYTREDAEKVEQLGEAKPFKLELHSVKPHASFVIETLDREHGYALPAWKAMGMPEPPTREQTKMLKQLALQTKTEIVRADEHGTLLVERVLAPWSIVSIRQS